MGGLWEGGGADCNDGANGGNACGDGRWRDGCSDGEGKGMREEIGK